MILMSSGDNLVIKPATGALLSLMQKSGGGKKVFFKTDNRDSRIWPPLPGILHLCLGAVLRGNAFAEQP